MGTHSSTTWLSRAACNGVGGNGVDRAHRERSLRLLRAAVPAGDGAAKPAARSASPTEVPSRPVPRMAMRSIMNDAFPKRS